MQSNCQSQLVQRFQSRASESNTTCPNRHTNISRHLHHHNQSNIQSKRLAATTNISKMFRSTSYLSVSSFRIFLVLASIFIVAHLSSSSSGYAVAKPLNQYQVKFRRLPPKEFSAALGSSITIECEAGASPPPTIHWLKDGKRILQADSDENQVDDLAVNGAQSIQIDDVTRISLSASRSRLYIDCADFIDEATYTCVAENAYSRVSAHTKLNLIKPRPAAVQVAANENDLALTEEALSELAAAGSLKSLDGAADSQSSPSSSPSSPAASNTNSGQLSAVPQCLSERLRLGGSASSGATPARIHMWTHNIVEIMKNNVVLYCRSNIKRLQQQQLQSQQLELTTPTKHQEQQMTSVQQKSPTVSWTLPDDKLVSEDQKDKYEVLETGDLLIKNLSWSDMGSYVCTVSDEQSSDSVSAFVYPAAVKANKKRATSGLGRMLNFR